MAPGASRAGNFCGEVVAELRDDPPKRLSQPLAYQVAARLLEACLASEA